MLDYTTAYTIYTNMTSALDEFTALQNELDNIGIDVSSHRISKIIDRITESLIICLGTEKVQMHESINGTTIDYTVIRSLRNPDIYLFEEGVDDLIYNMPGLSKNGALTWSDIWSAFYDGQREDLSKIETVLIEYYQ